MSVAAKLAHYSTQSTLLDIPAIVQHEATRAILNWLGCAVGGSRHEAIERALAALFPFSAGPHCTLLGRRERTDALHAALINGMSAHVLDFDDTHLRTLLHPSVPVASALLALSEQQRMSGQEFLLAFIVGVEIECRIANAIWFAHNVHWYITGTAGILGAAAATAKALGLTEKQTEYALGIACAQSAGTREMAGTMTKCFIHGRAAQNGLLAAILARQGFTSAEFSLEGPHGLAQVLAPQHDLSAMTAGVGRTYEILQNSYKPYACGVVAHPVIDACIRLREEHHLRAGDIKQVSLVVSPRALDVTGVQWPADGLRSKWSIYHSAAVALIDGAAGEHQYTDDRVNNPEVAELRARVTARADMQLKEVEAKVSITLLDGTTCSKHIEHVVGSVENPMSDRDLEEKTRALVGESLHPDQATSLIDACWAIASLNNVADLARLASAT